MKALKDKKLKKVNENWHFDIFTWRMYKLSQVLYRSLHGEATKTLTSRKTDKTAFWGG